ncbi:hypothetical protein BCV72DRAFT_254833 [Rhizopus microsporus var. microsporus]|uniref:Mediator of RNA polymerase II transcription subunit 5 n=1 Tax=Rhizopus microsporus var. microsporus TaxID=86635 RepID=A0A1X0RBT0_RHIZD|nr:hypothetical protein BCV72DRAFT_254833 [Rhizopus microsporus var. microsporus]
MDSHWSIPTKECLNDTNTENELCELLLSSIFSLTKVSDPLLESYLTFATTGNNTIDSNNVKTSFISLETFISQLVQFGPSTVSKSPTQWSYILKLLLVLLSTAIDTDTVVSSLQQGKHHPWVDLLNDLLDLLSCVVAVGLYPDQYCPSASPAHSPITLTSAISFHNTQNGFDSQVSLQSQRSMSGYDFDATLDLDNTQRMDEDVKEVKSVTESVIEERKKGKRLVEADNAALAAQIMIYLVEKKGAKRIFEVRNNQRRQHELGHEPWLSCQNRLIPSDQFIRNNAVAAVMQNVHVQKLLALVQRLTDSESERRMAVHMKYHELEDEGTARAMPSAGIMGFLYHMVQIRPSLENDFVVDQLLKLQTVKGSFDESFYLELWFTALTGLREAMLNTSCQGPPVEEKNKEDVEKGCSIVVATNRLLWKSLVLVKLPAIISKLQERKKLSSSRGIRKSLKEMNPIESSLRELKAFTGLLNACSQPACCFEYYAPDSMSSTLVDKITFGGEDEEEDDIMKMINDMSYSTDLNASAVVKAIRALSNHDIYTNIVHACKRLGFVRPKVAAELLKSNEDMMEIDESIEAKASPSAVVDQNIDQRMEILRTNLTFAELTELLHIGLVSPLHLQRIIDFIIQLLQEKTIEDDFYSVSKICDTLIESPCSVDLILQLYTPSDLLGPLERFCNHWASDQSINDIDMDEQTSNRRGSKEELEGIRLLYNKFGKIWNLVVSVVKRFKVYRDLNKVFKESDGFAYQFFSRGSLIYGQDIQDDRIERQINSWLSTLAGRGDDLDNLLQTTKPQDLLLMAPTIIHRCILLYAQGQIQNDTLMGMISYFQKSFLDFTQMSILTTLCDELLNGESNIALACLRLFITSNIPLSRQTNLHPILGSLESLLEYKRQEAPFLRKEQLEENEILIKEVSELVNYILKNFKIEKPAAEDQFHTETVTTAVTPDMLFEKAQMMFRYIVKSGRSMFMSDVDANTNRLWDNKPTTADQHVVSHYLDMVLFETALEIGGSHWFVTMIVSEVLEAGKSGGAVRAAELGSCLLSTPLMYSTNKHNSSIHLLRCLLQDVLPASLENCAQQNMSFFQGQTLGVFTSDCLVLMQDKNSDAATKLGQSFFETLVIDGHHSRKRSQQEQDGSRFADWTQTVTQSAVWRGFIKGLMSNPMIEEIWPDAFI